MPQPPSFSLLLKPASYSCNLRCRYCFYLPKERMFGPGAHRMSPGTLEAVVSKYMACPMPVHAFAWQGGEPTLMGVDFFREAVRLQRRQSRGGECTNALQTNGTLLDDEWGQFLREHAFLVGISLDGPEALHNRFRLRADGVGSYAEVLRGLEVLKRHGVAFNALTLVSAANQDHPEDVYEFLKERGVAYHQYIECVEFDERGLRRPYSLSPGKWGEFLCRLFDAWYPGDTRSVSIRLFDSILSRLLTGVPTMCPMSGHCCNYFVVEHDGGIYPCDFHVRPDLRIGNILETDFPTLWQSPLYQRWGDGKDPRRAECSACRYLPLCMGDCPKNRREGCSALCEDWKMFYSHTIERFEILARQLCGSPLAPARSQFPCDLS